MKAKNKAKIKHLEMCISAMRTAAKSSNLTERLTAVELEVEFTERISAIKNAESEPELALASSTH